MCQFLSAVVLRNGDVLTHPKVEDNYPFTGEGGQR